MDNSTGAFVESWNWTFQDGTPSTSTERNPDVVFSSLGWKTVTLTVGNANGGDTKVNEYAILVGGNEITPNSDFNEDFENVAADLNPYIAMNYVAISRNRKYTKVGTTAFVHSESGDRYRSISSTQRIPVITMNCLLQVSTFSISRALKCRSGIPTVPPRPISIR